MDRRRLLVAVIGGLFVAALIVLGCNGLIGTRDLAFVADAGAGTGDDGGPSPDDGGPGSDSAPCDPSATASDPDNCGACGHSCLGGGCEAGQCLPAPLTLSAGTPGDLAADSTYFYWADNHVKEDAGSSVIYRMSRDAGPNNLGTPEAIATVPGNPIYTLALSTGTLYFATNPEGDDYTTPSGTLYELDLTVGGAQPKPLVSNVPLPVGLSADSTNVYYAEELGDAGTGYSFEVHDYSLPGMADAKITDDDNGAYVTLASGGTLYWGEDLTCVPASDTCNATYACSTSNLVNCKQTAAHQLFSNPGTVVLAANGATLFGGSVDGEVYQYHLPSGPEETAIPDPAQPTILRMAADARDLYWTVVFNGGGGVVHRCPLDPTTGVCKKDDIVVVSPETVLVNGLVLESDAVYWSSEGDGKILRLAR